MRGGYGISFMKEVALEPGIKVWREAEKTCLRDSQRSDMEGKRFRGNGLLQLD